MNMAPTLNREFTPRIWQTFTSLEIGNIGQVRVAWVGCGWFICSLFFLCPFITWYLHSLHSNVASLRSSTSFPSGFVFLVLTSYSFCILILKLDIVTTFVIRNYKLDQGEAKHVQKIPVLEHSFVGKVKNCFGRKMFLTLRSLITRLVLLFCIRKMSIFHLQLETKVSSLTKAPSRIEVGNGWFYPRNKLEPELPKIKNMLRPKFFYHDRPNFV